MSLAKPLGLVLIPLAGATIAFGTWRLATAGGASGSDPHEHELRQLRAQVDELARAQTARASVDSALTGWHPAADRAAETPPAPVNSAAPKRKSPDELIADREVQQRESRRLHAERRVRMDDELAGEPRDPQWSKAAASTVERWFKLPELEGYSVDNMDCGTTLCRLKMRAPPDMPEPVQLTTILSAVNDKMGEFQGSSLSLVDQPDGSRAILLYLGRTGEPLPR